MNRMCVIYDSDEKYGKRLMNVINAQKGISYGISLFTDRREFIDYMKDKGTELVIISEECIDEDVLKVCLGNVILLMEDEEFTESSVLMYGENVRGVYKYQSSDRIIRAIMGRIGREEKRKGKTKLVGVYALGNSEKRTVFSLNLAKAYSKEKRTLYINLEEFSGLGELLPDNGGMTLSDALYRFRNTRIVCSNILSEIHSAGGVDYLPPVSSAEDIAYVETEQITEFIRQIGETGGYEVVVVDISNGVKHQWKLIGECDCLFMLEGDTYYTKQMIKNFEIYFLSSGMKEVLNNIVKIELPEDTGGLDGDFWRAEENNTMYRFARKLIS